MKRRSFVQGAVPALLFGARAFARGARGGSIPSNPGRLSNLQKSQAPNAVAYAALSVPAMAAGTEFADPVTGVRTLKVSSRTFPDAGSHSDIYSQEGLQISLAWGVSGNQYTIFFLNVGTGAAWLVDYTMGGSLTNYRLIPDWVTTGAGSPPAGMCAFSRVQPHILYLHTGAQLRMWNTLTNGFADTGVFPISWTGPTGWLCLNHDDTWAVANDSLATATKRYSCNLTSGATQTRTVAEAHGEVMGYNTVTAGNSGTAVNDQVWNVATNVLTTVGAIPTGNSDPFHIPGLNGYWVFVDTNNSAGEMAMSRLFEDGSVSGPVYYPRYYGQFHMCGHWWTQDSTNQYFLFSMWDQPSAGWSTVDQYGLIYANPITADTRQLGHSYSILPPTNGSDPYWSTPFATLSHDGKLCMFNSNMLDNVNGDSQVFIMEVPLS